MARLDRFNPVLVSYVLARACNNSPAIFDMLFGDLAVHPNAIAEILPVAAVAARLWFEDQLSDFELVQHTVLRGPADLWIASLPNRGAHSQLWRKLQQLTRAHSPQCIYGRTYNNRIWAHLLKHFNVDLRTGAGKFCVKNDARLQRKLFHATSTESGTAYSRWSTKQGNCKCDGAIGCDGIKNNPPAQAQVTYAFARRYCAVVGSKQLETNNQTRSL